MKIAIIQPRASYYIAGSEKVSFKHAEHLAVQGVEVVYYTSNTPKDERSSFLFDEFKSKKINNVQIKCFDLLKKESDFYKSETSDRHDNWLIESLAFNQEILCEIKRDRPDIIFSYYLPDSILKPLDILNVIYLSGYPKNRVPIYKSFLKFVDSSISISNVVASVWSEETSRESERHILSTGVDMPEEYTTSVTKKSKIDLVFAGRLVERKGIITLIESVKNSKYLDDIHLWILGDGELAQDLKRKIRNSKLTSNVTFTGNVVNPYDYFLMSDICVFPSHYGDGLMGVVLESMACGKPVITTRNNGNEDIIVSGQNGILIEAEKGKELTFAIDDLCREKNKRHEIGIAAKKTILENYSWEKHTNKLINIFKEELLKYNKTHKELR